MNPGIFISYSRDDQKQALGLLNMLRREGYDVWIDQEAIPGASIWSDEIVQNIKSCDIFIALLSSSSVSSANVGKEIGLAAEFGKTILPIEIGTVVLPGRLEYALAGIQKTDFHHEEAILHAIRKQAAKMDGTQLIEEPHKHRRTRKQRIRLRAIAGLGAAIVIAGGFLFLQRNSSEKQLQSNAVAVLPFATINLDRDSTHNLDIFSDVILTKLSTLSMVTVAGSGISSSYRDSRLNSFAIARELNARYIVEGLVRKSHDLNFVSVRIYDLKKGGEIWEQSYSGGNGELFSIREKVCSDIFGFLRGTAGEENTIRLAEENLAAHPNDPAAYASLGNRLVASDNIRALDLFQKAIKLDSENVSYYLNAGIVAVRQKDNGLAKDFGKLAVAVAEKKLKSYPDSVTLITNYLIALDLAELIPRAERMYDSLLILYPSDVRLNYNAACCFAQQGKGDRAVDILERLFPIAPGKRSEVRSDPDFDNIRMNPRFIKLMAGGYNQ
ncbi:MAG: TIR domain-containing protein [Candidatus Kapaibacterium sp.]